MNGMEHMLGALLKAMKFDPAEFKAKFVELVNYTAGLDRRLEAIEHNQNVLIMGMNALIADAKTRQSILTEETGAAPTLTGTEAYNGHNTAEELTNGKAQ